MKNYLPFAVREIRRVWSPAIRADLAIQSAQVSSLDVGFGERAILQDLNIYAYQATGEPSTQLRMRIGWLGKGFLTEKLLPAGLFINKSRPAVPVWEFVKPYILRPNQQLRSRVTGVVDNFGSMGLVFAGRRLKDDRPEMLYDTTEDVVAVGGGAGFADKSLRCPGDSPVALHSVAISDWDYTKTDNTGVWQIWSPQGREWFHTNPYIGPPPPANQKWIDPPTGLLALGEERGWVLDTGQTMLIEFQNIGTTNIDVMMTLRGSVEVEEEDWHG